MSFLQKWSQEEKEEGNDGHLEWKWRIIRRRKEKEVENMCFMAIDELDEVNSNLSDENIHDVFEELYKDFEKLSLENIYLKKKIQQLEKELGEVKEKFSNVEISKTHLEKENELLRKKNEWLTSSVSIFSCGQKYFEMILASQKCVFDKQGLGFKSSKNQKYLKNYFVKESTSASPSITCNFCWRGGHISTTCLLRNGSKKEFKCKS